MRSPIREEGKPDAVEVTVEADLAKHGLTVLVGVLDLVQNERIIDFKTSSSTPNADRAVLVNATQATALFDAVPGKTPVEQKPALSCTIWSSSRPPKLVVTRLPPVASGSNPGLLRVIDSYLVGLERPRLHPLTGAACVSCEFFNECAAWHY